MEKIEEKNKNFLITSLSGIFFVGNDNERNFTSEKTTETELAKTFFNGNKPNKFFLTNKDYTNEKIEGFTEKIIVYYDSNETDVWNYNDVLSAYLGKLVYSANIVFLTPSVYNKKVKKPMDNILFQKLVNLFFVNIKKLISQNQVQEIKEEETSSSNSLEKIDFSDKYKLLDINFNIGLNSSVSVDKLNQNSLDDFYEEHYTQKYQEDFVFKNSILKDIETGSSYETTILVKPGLLTLILEGDKSIVENYFIPNFQEENLKQINLKIKDLQEKYSSYDIKRLQNYSEKEKTDEFSKEKEEIIQNYFKKFIIN